MYKNRCCNFRRHKFDQEVGRKNLEREFFTTDCDVMQNVKTEVIPAIIGTT